uniref:SFRICE_032533 n=1 Tax=Spodoptera frugiperda TaxID=7108 RepID=A0A2H1WX48_SPOFR
MAMRQARRARARVISHDQLVTVGRSRTRYHKISRCSGTCARVVLKCCCFYYCDKNKSNEYTKKIFGEVVCNHEHNHEFNIVH